MNPPISDSDGNKYEYVVASATRAYGQHETYLFAANETGEVIEWGELPGSMKGTTSHSEALENAGYEIAP